MTSTKKYGGYDTVSVRVPSNLKRKLDKKCAKLRCSQTFIVNRLLEEWVNGDLLNKAPCDTFVLNK